MATKGMATAERPPARIDGKPNPAYQAWYRAQKKAANSPQPETLTLRVIGPARNSNFVLCDLDGEKVPVQINRRDMKMLLGKEIPVRKKEDGTYTHAK